MANSEYNYIPTYIRRTINNRPKDVVTAKYWNELFNLLITQGDHTAEELGNILNYFSTRLVGVESEIAESAEAIANIREVFRINVTYSHSDSVGGVYSADKTFDEIKAAYDAGQLPYVVNDALSGFYDIYTFGHFWYDESSAQGFVDFERYLIRGDTLKTDTLRIHSHALASGSNIERRIEEFNAPGGSVVIEGTASDDLSEVTITTPDAWTLVSEAWNSEKHPLVVLRLSDELYAYLTCVSSLDLPSQSTGVALFSLSAQKLLDSTPPYSIWMYEDGTVRILPVEGINGADGVGIQSVEQTTTSTEDGGTNIITVTKTDGTSSTFTVRNGSKGSAGADGKSAYQYAQESGYTGTEEEFAEKLAQEQLYGTTLTLTPTQVYDAVSAGTPVKVQYFDGTYGSLSFTAFNVESSNVIVSQRIISTNGEYILAELIGNKPNGTWNFVTTTLAEKTDIPSLEGYATEAYVQNYHDNTKQDIITDLATIRSGASKGATAVQPEAGKGLFSGSYNDLTNKPTIPTALPNPNAITFTGAVTGSYDGSAAMTVNIPSAVTDAHINSLIDTKLGVIENGSY